MRPPRVLSVAAAMLAGVLLTVACRPGGDSSEVTFRTADGFLLEGRVFGDGEVAVVLAHMFPSDMRSWFAFAGDLASDGYASLTFNFRGYGSSEGSKDIDRIHRDVAAAIDFVRRELGVSTIVLVGASMGGTASLVAAAEEDVAGVATLSAPMSVMGLDASEAITRVEEPMMFIAATGDSPAAESAEAFTRATLGVGDLELVAGEDHGTDLLDGSSSGRVEGLLTDFISQVTS
jgi:pimeloyl-ACP methyl ester carboxylesterase